MSDSMQEHLVSDLKAKVAEINRLVDVVRSSKSDYSSVYKEVTKEFETEETNKITTAIEELENRLEAIYKAEAERIVSENAGMGTEIEAAKERIRSLRKSVGNLQSYVIGEFGESAVAGIDKPKNLSGGTKAGEGTGTRRIRGFQWMIEGKDTQFDNLSTLVKELDDVDIEQIQAGLFSQYGEQPKDWEDQVSVTVEGVTVLANRKE